MGMFDEAQVGTAVDPTTGQDTEVETSPSVTSDYAYALDTHAAQAGDRSLFDAASDVVTKGIPLTGLQIVNSFANTAIELGNVFGAGLDKWSIEAEAPDVEAATGQSGLNQYYEDHKQGIDMASFALGSVIPGMAGIKVFKAGTAALSASRALAEGGEASGILARATGLLPSVQTAAIRASAEKEIMNADSLFNGLTREKYTSIALGFADQGLQALSYEVATAATMKASPLLDDKSFGETTENIISGALLGAGIGGVIEGIGTRAIFNKIVQTADDATKAQQVYTNLGKGNYEAGDVVNSIIHSIYNQPAPTSGLGRAFSKMTGDAATLTAKKSLSGLVKDGDQELTNSMYDIIQKMKNEGQMSQEDAYNTFARLAKVQRVTDTVAPVVDDGSFYINKRAFARGQSKVNWSDAVSSKATPVSDLNLRYQLKPGAFDTEVAQHNDTFIDVNGNPQLRFKNAQDAFETGGADLFINAKGDVIVNPNAPNIRPIPKIGESRPLSQEEELAYRKTGKLPDKSGKLYGTQVSIGDKPGATILNTQTGAITDSAVPTVGDHGALVYQRNGLKYGEDKFSPQSIDDELSPDTPTIDVSARYAWMSKRGMKAGDDISPTDIPAMETLARHMQEGGDVKKIKFDGDDTPDLPGLIEAIKNAKDDQLTADIKSGMSSEEAALRSNVPEDYIKNGFQAPNGADDFILPPEAHSAVSHVKLWYDIGNLNMQDGQIIRGIRDTQYRVQLIKAANQDAHAAYIGSQGEDPANYLIDGTSSQAGIKTAPGPGMLKTSSANYNTFGQQWEKVGRFVSGLNQKGMAEVSRVLTPSANALRSDQAAAAEAGMFRSVRQRTAESYSFLSPELEAKYIPGAAEKPSGNIAVLTNALVRDKKTGKITDFNPLYIPKGFIDGSKVASGELPTTESGLRNYYSLSPKVADWERANQGLNDARVVHRNNFNAANGIQRTLPTGTLYTPPINTAKHPYFALVKARPGTGMADDSVAAVTASSQAELQAKIAQLGEQYSVFTKTGESSIKQFHEVEGDYQFNRNFANNRVSNDIARKGILNDVFPETRAQNIIEDQVEWHARQVTGLNRDYVELGNAQLFAELRSMGDRFSSTGGSQTGYIASALARQQSNPYQDYINTALNISPKEQYRTWAFANEKAESLFSTAFDALKSGFQSARAGVLPYEQASDLAEKFGLGKIYENAVSPLKAYYDVANKLPDSKSLAKFVGGANTVLGTGIIRLDAYQSLIHVISTPMLAAVEAASARSQILKGLTSTPLPGDAAGRSIPATSKLLFNAVKNFWDDGVQAKYGQMYHDLGADKTTIGIHRQMMDQLTLPWGSFTQSGLLDKVSKAADLGAKLSGSDFTNTFNHFISADVGRQIFEAAGFEGKALTDQVMTFVNRVQGNYIAGQRPVAFQGPIGQAMGLFQTFGVNMLQNLMRYVENGEAKTLGLLSGLQTSLFGLQGMPGFNFINQHLVGMAAGNSSHDDLYSGIASGLGAGRGTLGHYLLYGVTSNWLDANLYSRGDISPRNLTIFPTNPLDFPAIKGGINVVSNLLDTASKIANGAPTGASLMLGLEHNGLNRPLAGLAQIAQGFATNAQGNVIGTTQGVNGNSELFSMANFSRLLGARPLDEAAAMGTTYRLGLYTAKKEAQINEIGEAAKVSLYKNGELAPDEVESFASRYAAVGGDISKFNSTMARWTMGANAATANRTFKRLKDPIAINAMLEMGGKQLPDYLNQDSVVNANTLAQE